MFFSDYYLLYEFVEIVVVLVVIKGEKVVVLLSFDEDMSFYDVIGNVVRVECVNGGESFNRLLEVGCILVIGSGFIENGVDCCLVEDCNGFVFESLECFGFLFIKGVNDGNKIVLQQYNVNLGSEGNKLINLGIEIEFNIV